MRLTPPILLLLLFASFPLIGTSTADSTCGSDNGVDSLSINLPPSGAVPADEQVQLSVVVKDAAGDPMGASVEWNSSNGSITSDGLFTPWQKGEVQITVCSGLVSTNAMISVIQGDTVSLALESSTQVLTTDDELILSPRRIDNKGNSAPAQVPSSNWSIPEGSSIHQGVEIIWEPVEVGNQTIGFELDGMQANTSIEVLQGEVVSLRIEGPQSLVSGEWENYSLYACDAEENCRLQSGSWVSTGSVSVEVQEGVLETCMVGAGTGGQASIQASWDGLSTEMDLEIGFGPAVVSRLVVNHSGDEPFTLEYGGLDVIAGNGLQLSMMMEDQYLNQWFASDVGWEVEDSLGNIVKTGQGESLDLDLTHSGVYQLTMTPRDGLPLRIDITVAPAPAESYTVSGIDSPSLVVASGEAIDLLVIGTDEFGNSFASDVTWQFGEEYGVMEKGSEGAGSYTFHPSAAAQLGPLTLGFGDGNLELSVPIQLVVGQAKSLQIILTEDSGMQGDVIEFSVSAQDNNGNPVDMPEGYISVSCSCGKTTDLGEYRYQVELEESGDRHSLSAEMQGLARSVVYIDVTDTLFDGMLGDNEQVVSIGIVGATLILLIAGVAMYRRTLDSADDEEYIEAAAPAAAPPATAFQPPPLAVHSQPQPVLQPPPLAVQPIVATVSMPAQPQSSSTSLGNAMDLLAPAADDSPVPVESNDGTEEVAEEVSEVPSEGDSEVEFIASKDGPMTTAGVLLKALPGTNPGDSGWYHGPDGRPMRWDAPQ